MRLRESVGFQWNDSKQYDASTSLAQYYVSNGKMKGCLGKWEPGQFLQSIPLKLLQLHNSRSKNASSIYNSVLYLLFKNLSYRLLSLLILSASTASCGCNTQKFTTCRVKIFFILTVDYG